MSLDVDALLRAFAKHIAPFIVAELGAAAADDLLDGAQAAKLARCATRRVADAARSGALPSSRRGRSRVFKRSDLLAWVSAAPCQTSEQDDIDRRVARLTRKAKKPVPA